MANSKPRLFADGRGVWREQTLGRPSGIEWEEVYRVSGHKLDGITEIFTCVALDFEYGEFIELNDNWPGFVEVIAAITKRLPDINPDWFQTIEQLAAGDPAVHVWRR